MKILIVDDDKWYAESLVASLQSNNNMKIVSSPEETIQEIDDFRPDVVLLDFYLGTRNALTLLNELQSYIDTRKTPIVILSSNNELQIDDFKKYGVKAVLNKATITPEEVYRCLKA